MQCPSCGFENMPGNERCCICSAELTSKPASGPLTPPRSKDRSLFEKLRWSIRTSPGLQQIRNRVPIAPNAPSLPDWWNIQTASYACLAVVPGLGHMTVRRKALTGLALLLTSLLALSSGILLYRLPISNILFLSVVGLSFYSVVSTVLWFCGDNIQSYSRWLTRVGTALIILSGYLSAYVVLRLMVQSFAPIYTVNGRVAGPVTRGDTVLLRHTNTPQRGEVIVARLQDNIIGVGPVVGMPGDTIYVSDCIYVNGKPVTKPFDLPPSSGGYSEFAPGQCLLADDEYWLMPDIDMVGHGLQELTNACIARSSDVIGRVSWVLNPPSHRRAIPINSDSKGIRQ